MDRTGLEETKKTALAPVLLLTALCSLGTGMFWHGLPFVARHTYGFDQTRNLVLYSVMGAVYTLGAFNSARLGRLLGRWLSARALLGAAVAAQAAACLLPLASAREPALWASAILVTSLSSLVWPVIESYLTAGRHGSEMRSAIGWFNLTWAPTAALPLYLMAPLIGDQGRWALAGMSGANLLGLATLAWFAIRPGHHDPDLAVVHVGPEYRLLLRSARVLLPLSYVLHSAMTPLLPYRLEELAVPVGWETPAAGTWLVVRFLAFLVLWRLSFWHGRWGTLLLGGLAMAGGFGVVVAAPSFPLMLLGLGLVGAGHGVIYYAALYYAMAVGRAAVDASGTHEGLIGAGYGVGPLAGLAGRALERALGIAGGVGLVAVVWTLLVLGGAPALRPYVEARRRRPRAAAGASANSASRR